MKTPDRPLKEWWARVAGGDPTKLAGTRDVAELLGVSRERVGQLARTHRAFPRPLNQQYGRIWRRAGIDAWVAVHRADLARPDNPFLGDAAEVLRAADQEAAAMRHGYLASGHVWIALARPDAPGAAREVLASLGVDAGECRHAMLFVNAAGEGSPLFTRPTPRAQELLGHAVRVAASHEGPMRAEDLAIAMIDGDEVAPQIGSGRRVGKPFRRDFVLNYLERRALDVAELRRRLEIARDDPKAVARFARQTLPKRRPAQRTRKRPAGLDLAPNPLGHDPWDRQPWGSAFAHDKNERMLKVNGEQWFFDVDRDGYFVRTRDGRPVGHRWRVEPKPADQPVNGFTEVLPMPAADVAYWPDYRYPRDA